MNSTGSTGFWIVGSANGYDIEIDLLEYSPKLNNTPNQSGQAWGPPLTVYMSGHLWAYPGHAKNGTDYAPTFIRPTVGWKPTWDGSAEFHVYGLDWNADTLTWYDDGVQRRQIKNSNWIVPGCLMFDAEITNSVRNTTRRRPAIDHVFRLCARLEQGQRTSQAEFGPYPGYWRQCTSRHDTDQFVYSKWAWHIRLCTINSDCGLPTIGYC